MGDDRALETARAAFELMPENTAVMDSYGWILLQDGQVEKSRELLANAAAKTTNASTHYHYAMALVASGKPDQAKEILERAEAEKLFNEL
jgi:Tfp pilus assembly protein PilF